MTTYNISNTLLNNAQRTATWVALSNHSASTPAPAWLVWSLVALLIAFTAFGVWVIWDTWYR